MINATLIKRVSMLIVFIAVGAGSFYRFFYSPVNEREERLSEIRSQTAAFKKGTPNAAAINRARREVESVVLAVRVDDFEHRLRTELSSLAHRAGLGEIVISHSAPEPVMSPVLGARIESIFKKAFRSGPDFYQVQGRLTGRGTPEAISRAIASVQSQPWIQQVQTVKVTPLGRQRRSMQIDLGFAVLFSPTAALPADHTTEILPTDPTALQAAMALASRPIFRPPDPEPVIPPAAVAQRPQPAPAPIPQDGNWRISGIITDPTPEVWLVNSKDAQQRVLGVGDAILNATVVGVQHDQAQILIDDIRYRVLLGRTLADRQPITEEEPSE